MNSLLKIFSVFKSLFLGVTGLLFFGGVLALLVILLITAAENNYITINIAFVFGILLNLWFYRKYRKPILPVDSWKRESKIVGFLGSILSLFATINYWQGFISAPIVAFVIGALGIYLNYAISQDGKKNLEKYASDPKFKYEPILKRTPQWVIGSLVALLVVSGYWYIEIQKNEETRKNEGIEEALSLVDFEYYQDSPSSARIKIDSVVGIEFSKVKAQEKPGKILQICIDPIMSYSRDGRFYQEIYVPTEVCFKEESTSYWSQYSIRDVVREVLKDELAFRLG
jgi:hypothetical protein